MSRLDALGPLARKAVDAGLREIDQAPEVRQARALRRRLPVAPAAPDGPKILFLTPRDWSIHVQWEAMLAQALRLRGADVSFLTCGGGLEICDRVNCYEGPPVPCRTCTAYTRNALAGHGLPERRIADGWVDDDPLPWPELEVLGRTELRDLERHGLHLGRLLDVPLPWFLCNSDLDEDPLAGITMRRFLRSASRIATGITAQLDAVQPDIIVMLNGLFLFEGIAAALAEQRGIRVVSYERGFIHGTLHFAHGPDAQRYEVEPALWDEASPVPLTVEEDRRLDAYLEDRRLGLQASVQLWPAPTFTEARTGPADRRQVVLFTNLTWDSAVLGRHSAYESMQHWLIDVIGQLGDREDVSLVVRIHPAEVRVPGWETREPAQSVIDQAFPVLPANVRVLGPDDPTSSYPLMESADLGLVYSSTTGLELALAGTPVVVGATAHYAGKGFTLEPPDPGAHRAAIEAVLTDPAVHAPDVDQARRYANLFFFRAAIPAPLATEPVPGLARLATTDPDDLRPGAQPGLDAICESILTGAPFRAP